MSTGTSQTGEIGIMASEYKKERKGSYPFSADPFSVLKESKKIVGFNIGIGR